MSNDTTPQPLTAAVDGLTDRRAMLRCGAALAFAGLTAPILVACGSDGEAGSTSSPTTGSTPTDTATSGTPTTGSSGTVLGKASEIPVGGGMVYKDKKVIVVQPTAGTYKGYTTSCTHMGVQITAVEGGTMNCPAHGSKFKIADGSVANGPATTPLPTVTVAVEGGNVVAQI
jgi:nitrite reductase/ring-hydroxylating ferredoxin subunit